jgi:hypothetical protein
VIFNLLSRNNYYSEMDDDIPQDEYFEWEDIISYKPIAPSWTTQKATHHSTSHFNQRSTDDMYDSDVDASVRSESSVSLGGFSATDSISTQTSSSFCGLEDYFSQEHEHLDEIPSYESDATLRSRQPLPPKTLAALVSSQPEQSEIVERAEDDTAVIPTPEKHVDYLSHDWSEEDIWSTWKYLKSTRQVYKNSERLVNASWRMWMKERHQLPETEPMSINWMKDKDTTWLYGPFQQNPETTDESPKPIYEFVNQEISVRPILKKASLSEKLLRRSISSAALAREASFAAKEAHDLTEHGAVRHASLPAPLALDVEMGTHSALKKTKSVPVKNKSVRFCDEVEDDAMVSPTSANVSGSESVFEASSDDSDDEDINALELSPKSSTTAALSNVDISAFDLQDTAEVSPELNFSFGEFTLSPECESDASDEDSDDDYFDSETMETHDITRSVLDPVRENLVDSVMDEFWAIFHQEWESGFNQRNGGSRKSSSGSTTSSSASTEQASTGNAQRKRQRMDSESEKGDDGRGPQSRHQPKPRKASNDSVKFACPFRKHDSSTYNIYTHRVCALSNWQTIARVKEHIYRCHQTPAHCKRCWATFKTQQQLDAHITVASEDICEVQAGTAPAGISPTIERQLRSRKKAHPNQSEEDRWRDIYKILFPNSEVPSPYFEAVQEEGPSSPDSRELSNYEDYIRRELPRLVRSNIESVVRRETQPLEASLIGSLVSIIQDCQDRVFRSYREAQGIEHEARTPARSSTASPSIAIPSHDPHDFRDDLDFLDAAFQSPATSMSQATPSFQQLDSVVRPEVLGFSDSGYASEPFCYCTNACTCGKGAEEGLVKDEVAAATLSSDRPWIESMSHPNWQHVERADDEADWWMNI